MKLRPIVLAWWVWALGVAVIIGCTVLIASCAAPLPHCDKPIAHAVNSSYGPVTVFDEENTAKLIAMVAGLAAGTCQLDKGGT